MTILSQIYQDPRLVKLLIDAKLNLVAIYVYPEQSLYCEKIVQGDRLL